MSNPTITGIATLDIAHAKTIAVEAARAAGELLACGQKESYAVEQKQGLEFVTDCDKRSEDLLVARISEAFPDHAIVAEEGTGSDEGAGEKPTWFIDPLDGTVNFAHGLPWYAVSIGLEFDGNRQLGIVYAPSVGWEATAIRGRGTTLNGKSVHVSKTNALKQGIIATGFAYDRHTRDRNNVAELERVLMAAQGIRRVGAAALDCLMVACGWLDGYWEFGIKAWDVSAGALLVEEAGGRVTTTSNGTFYSTHGDIIATNGHIHEELVALVAVDD